MKYLNPVTITLVLMFLFFVIYVILVYPEERAQDLNKDYGTQHIIEIKDGRFNPEQIEINAGESVIWINYDTKHHRIVGKDFSSEILEYRESYTHTFEKKGTYEYSSENYPGMSGTIIVR